MKRPLRVMKFGGTSVGDAGCIARVAQIVREASRESSIVVVVSAMRGVTNHLIEAANRSEANEREAVAGLFDSLRRQHDEAIELLIRSEARRAGLTQSTRQIFAEGERLCEGTSLLRELTPRTLDSISSLGERLSAPIVASTLAEAGVESEPIDATELILTDSYHGGAQPLMEATRERSQSRLKSLLEGGVVPVVTGFIGATQQGVLTTLGRGGSDYSATILGAALDADEIIIWTDVNGVLTADPRLVPEARTIPEISY